MSDYGTMPDISQLAPATGPVGQPASGTYGEKAALADLQRSLPLASPAPQQGGASAPSASPGPMPLPGPSGVLPKSIMAPSTRPMEPLSTPLTQQIPVGETPSARQRQWLEAIVRDPSKRETTRVWAQSVLDALGNR